MIIPTIMFFRKSYIPIFLTAAALIVSGCYTILTHPSVRHEKLESGERVSFHDNCLQCHTESDVHYFYQQFRNQDTISVAQQYLPSAPSFPSYNADPYFMFNYPWWYSDNWAYDRFSYDRSLRSGSSNSQNGSGSPFQGRRSGHTRGSGNSTSSGSGISIPSGTSSGGTTTSGDTKSTDSNTRGRDNTNSTPASSDRTRDNTSTNSSTDTRTRDNSSSRNNSSTSTPTRSGSTRGK